MSSNASLCRKLRDNLNPSRTAYAARLVILFKLEFVRLINDGVTFLFPNKKVTKEIGLRGATSQ